MQIEFGKNGSNNVILLMFETDMVTFCAITISESTVPICIKAVTFQSTPGVGTVPERENRKTERGKGKAARK